MSKLLKPGDRLGRWLVIDRPRFGTWGVVYVLREPRYDKEGARPEVVIGKTMRPEFADTPARVAQFEHECRTWLSLGDHKNIVRLFTVERCGRQVFAIGEYIPETRLPNTLRGWLEHNLVDAEFAFRFGIMIVRALRFAQSQGLVAHQDLKPENIMVTSGGVAKVTDWGLSRMASAGLLAPSTFHDVRHLSSPGNATVAGGHAARTLVHGTRGYTAPELVSRRAPPTQRADFYSLAVIVTEMLTGRRPSADMSATDLEFWLNTLTTPARARMAAVLARCLSAHADKRPDTTDELEAIMAEGFEDLTGVPAEAPPTASQEGLLDLQQRAYGLFMLGMLDEGMRLEAEATRRLNSGVPEEEQAVILTGRETPDEMRPLPVELTNRLQRMTKPLPDASTTPRAEDATAPIGPVVVTDDQERGYRIIVSRERIARVKRELQADPANRDLLDKASVLYETVGDLDQALRICRSWVRNAPHDVKALWSTAEVLAMKHEWSQAIKCVDRILALMPDTAWFWLARSDMCEAAGNVKEAIRSAEKAVGAEPWNVDAWIRHGHLLSVTNDIEDAMLSFHEATRLDPGNAIAWYNLGTCQEQMGPCKGVEAIRRAIELDPGFAPALNTYGCIMEKAFDFQDAIRYFQRAIDADPNYARPWFNLGQVYRAIGRSDKAREAYREALAIDPAHALARTALRQLDEHSEPDLGR